MNTSTSRTGKAKTPERDWRIFIEHQEISLYVRANAVFFGVMGLVLFGMFRVLTDRPLRKEHGTQFCIRYMLYVIPLLVVPPLLLGYFLQSYITQQGFDAVLFVSYYVSGFIAAKLLCIWMQKVGI